MSIEHLQKIREYELNNVFSEIPQGSKILEIGAGAGWQTQMLVKRGFAVEAIDVEDTKYLKNRVWPVLTYDGKTIPFPDQYFDVIFSSTVLEHIPDVEQFQCEIKRVLKPDGIAIHVLPKGYWRFWTNVVHYPFVLKILFQIVVSKISCTHYGKDSHSQKNTVIKAMERLSKQEILIQALFPPRHGAIGNSISEIYWFSKSRWDKLFITTNWTIIKHFPNNLFYTGYSLFGSLLSMQVRTVLSYLLGSSSQTYVLKEK